MKINDLIKKGLLKKEISDIEKSKKSIKVAYRNIKDAKIMFDVEEYNWSMIATYMAMFHAARALLFKDGYREKSHFAVLIFLEENYSDKLGKDLIFKFNLLRNYRHHGLYNIDIEFKKEDVLDAIKDSKYFINKVKEILELK
jgi:uncharacterized protein (UPF0332 family)